MTRRDHYKGPLSIAQLLEGSAIVAANAQALAGDARLLLDAKRTSTALAVGIAALEEGFKSVTVLMALDKIDRGLRVDWNVFWANFLTHEPKQTGATTLSALVAGEKAGDLMFETIFEADLEKRRQDALYVDVDSKEWLTPGRVNPDFARRIVETAEENARVAVALAEAARTGVPANGHEKRGRSWMDGNELAEWTRMNKRLQDLLEEARRASAASEGASPPP